jgi:hypothetical protein
MPDDLIATNPQTGKQVRWDGKAWQPYMAPVGQRMATGAKQGVSEMIIEPSKAAFHGVTDPPRNTFEKVADYAMPGVAVPVSRAVTTAATDSWDALKYPIDAIKKSAELAAQGKGAEGAWTAATAAIPGFGRVFGQKGSELISGSRKGGDLATPLSKDLTEAGIVAASEKAPEAVNAVRRGTYRAITGTGDTWAEAYKQKYLKTIEETNKSLDAAKVERAQTKPGSLAETNQLDAAHKLKVDEIMKDHAERVARNRANFQEKMDKFNKQNQAFQQSQATAKQKFDFAHQQGPDFQRVSGMANQLANDNLPKTFKAAKADTDANWNAFRISLGDKMVPQTPLFEAITDAEDNILSGSHERVALFRDILKDAEADNPLNSASVFRGAGREARGGTVDLGALAPSAQNKFLASLSESDRAALMPKDMQLPGGDITFDDGRRTLTSLNRAEQRALNSGHGDVYRAVKSVKDSWEKVIDGSIPEQLKPRYQALKQDYSQFAKDWYNKKSPVKRLMEAATDKDRIDLISGKNADNLAEILDRYGGHVGTAKRVRALKQQVEQMKTRSMAEPGEPNQATLESYTPPKMPERFDIYKARLKELEDLFQSMADPARTASEGPNRYGILRSGARRFKASRLADPARREFIASDTMPNMDKIKALLVSILGSQAVSGSSGGR